MEINQILSSQKQFFRTGVTLSVNFRIQNLKKLYSLVKENQSLITESLFLDLGKSDYEGFMCEVGLALTEINYMIKHLRGFASEKTVKTPLAQFASRSYTKPVPYGNVLIMSPWNYPFLLTIEPLANAIAAGNTAIIKPSAYSPSTSQLLSKLLGDCFNNEYVAVVTGGRKENSTLLEQPFDFIFFTGSQSVGKEVLRQAAERLTPTILELGGKSPCILDSSCNISLAAKRIVFGKFLNCGRTCVAPDYVLCHKSIKNDFINEVTKEITLQYGSNPLENSDYGKIVNNKHFERLCSLMSKEKIIFGGDRDYINHKISPTIMDNVTWQDPIMQEEIFGPILPILTYDNLDEVISILQEKPKPLALYFFSNSKSNIKTVTEKISYGGGCINDTIIHLATSEMGFGGVGESGMGCYHGKAGFYAFSHTKSIVNKKNWIDLPMRYQPYNRKFFGKLLKFFLR